MVICEGYLHKFGISKDMEKKLTMKKGEGTWYGSGEGGGAFMSNTNYMKTI